MVYLVPIFLNLYSVAEFTVLSGYPVVASLPGYAPQVNRNFLAAAAASWSCPPSLRKPREYQRSALYGRGEKHRLASLRMLLQDLSRSLRRFFSLGAPTGTDALKLMIPRCLLTTAPPVIDLSGCGMM